MTAPDDMLKLAELRTELASTITLFSHHKSMLLKLVDEKIASAERQSGEVVAWRWRYKTRDDGWSKWIMLECEQVDGFRAIQTESLTSGHVELQPLYAAPSETGHGQLEVRSGEVREKVREHLVKMCLCSGDGTYIHHDATEVIDGVLAALASRPAGAQSETIYCLELAHSLLPDSDARDRIFKHTLNLRNSCTAGAPKREVVQIDANLVQRCTELLDWSQTGLLNGGKGGAVRELAKQLETKIGENYALTIAEGQTKDDAMREIVRLAALPVSSRSAEDK